MHLVVDNYLFNIEQLTNSELADLMVDRQLRITAANNELALFIEEQIRRQNLESGPRTPVA
jgi:hypothetical protein